MVTGPEKEGELGTTSMKFEFRLQFPCPLICQISTSQRE